MPNQYKWFINYIFRKKYLSAHMIPVLNSYPPKSVLLSIYFHNVCIKEVKSHICGVSNLSRLAFAIKIINHELGHMTVLTLSQPII